MDPPGQHCQSTEWSLHCSMLSLRLKGRWTPLVNTVRAQSDLFTVQCCHWDSKADGPPSQHCQSTEWSLHCSMLSFRLKGRGTPLVNTLRKQSDLFTVQCCHSDSKADGLPSRDGQSTEWSLHCSMLLLRLKGRWTPPVNIVRAQSDLFTVQCCHSDSKADGPPMCKTLPEHRVISSLFNVVIETQRQMATRVNTVRAQSYLLTVQCCHSDSKAEVTPPVNTVRAQSYLFTVQCCHSDSKADGPHQSTLSEHRVISSLFNVVIETQRQTDTPQSTLSEHSVISSLFNVVIQTQRQMNPLQNTVRAQSDLFTVQCCHSDSHTYELPMCKTLPELRVISSLFNVVIQTQRQMNPMVNIVRAQSDLFTVQCCHSDSKADGPPQCKTLSEHRVISSLFNVVIQTQRQMDPPGQHCQSTESIVSFTVQCCHSDSKADGPPMCKHCQSTEWSLHCSMLSFRLKGRWNPWSTLSEHRVISSLFNVFIQTQRQMDTQVNTVRAQSDLFTVQCCHSDSKADGPPSQHCQSTEWSLHCSMLSFRLKGRWTPQSTLSEHRVISSLFNVVIQTQRQMATQVNTVRAQSYLFTVQCCHSDSKAEGTPPVNTVRAQSYLFTVQCCHWDSKADGPHQSTLSEHSVISSLFNVVIETQRQTDTPQSTLSEHRVISSLFNVVIQTQRQMNPLQNTVRAQSDLFTVQCCHSDSHTYELPMCKTLPEHRVISSLFNVVIETQRLTDTPQSTLSEHRVISSLFNVVIQTQRQMKPMVNIVRAQSDLFTVQCCHSDSKADKTHGQHCQSTEWSLHCLMLSLRLKGKWTPPGQHCQSTEWSLHCSMLSFRLKGRWTPPVNIVRAQSYLFTVQCCHSDSKSEGPPFNTVRAQSDLFTVQCCHSDSKVDAPPFNTVRAHSDLFTVQCCHSDSNAGGHRWSTLSEHRVFS